jgi:hypothetical protein
MMQVFGEKLVRMPMPMDGEGGCGKEAVEGLVMTNKVIDELPSPEQLKGRILLKASKKSHLFRNELFPDVFIV